jgi:hypothetical protein
MARPPQHRKTAPAPTPSIPPIDNTAATPVAGPVFAQPKPTADPTRFSINHPSDAAAYKTIDALNAQHKLGPIPFPAPHGGVEPVLTLAQVLGKGGDDAVKAIAKSGQLVFHAVGDTGSVSGPENISKVADKMVADFDEEATQNVPRFFFHLGDVIYNFGEMQYYYDQFYEPYREYAAPILAIAGNHDGMVAPGTTTVTLAAFLENFCASKFEIRPEAGGLSRTAQIQPGVFFTFEAPLVRIIALYSNVLEDPGVIASKDLGTSQLDFLKAALTRAKKFAGALILAHHHPAYTVGSHHGWSEEMLAQIDAICEETGVWPHASPLRACAQLSALYPRSSNDTDSLHHRRQWRPRRRSAQARAESGRFASGVGQRRQEGRLLALCDAVSRADRAPAGGQGQGFDKTRELRRPGLRLSQNRRHPEAIAH